MAHVALENLLECVFVYVSVIVASIAGAFLALSGGLLSTGTSAHNFTARDAAGIAMGAMNNVILACYYVFLSQIDLKVPKEAIFWVVTLFQIMILIPISFSIDDW
jgi:ABC-type enterobactin transport system permease subunit